MSGLRLCFCLFSLLGAFHGVGSVDYGSFLADMFDAIPGPTNNVIIVKSDATRDEGFLDMVGRFEGKTVLELDPGFDAEQLKMSLEGSEDTLVLLLGDEHGELMDTLTAAGIFPGKLFWILPSSMVGQITKFGLDSNIFTYTTKGAGLTIDEVYTIKDGDPIVKWFGDWSASDGLAAHMESKYTRRADLQGTTLRNIVLAWCPNVCYDLKEDGSIENYSGFFTGILEQLMLKLNFTVDTKEPLDGNWGAVDPDGTWNGMVGMLHRKEADLVSTALSVSMERAQVIDYSINLDQSLITLLIPIQKTKVVKFWTYVNVFMLECWLVVAVCLFGLGTGYMTIAHFLPREYLHGEEETESFILLNGIALSTICLLQREYTIVKHAFCTKILWFVSCAFGYFIFSYYSGVLTSLMTSQDNLNPITRYQDVVDLDYKTLVVKDSIGHTILRDSPPGTELYNIYQTMKDDNGSFVSTPEEGFAKQLENDKTVFYLDVSFPKRGYVLLKAPGTIYAPFAYGLQKNSEFGPLFNFHLLSIRETGMWRSLRQIYEVENDVGGGEAAIVLGFDNISFPFSVACASFFIAIAMLLAERGVYFCTGLVHKLQVDQNSTRSSFSS